MVSWKWNVRYMRAVNSCDRRDFVSLLEELLVLEDAFTRKCYIWNWIRGREFYKNLAYYVTTLAKNTLDGTSETPAHDIQKIEDIIKIVMTTEKRDNVKQSFVWNITKQAPIITIDTIRYMSAERITHYLQNENRIINDSAMEPFIGEIINLKTKLTASDITLTETIDMIFGDKK